MKRPATAAIAALTLACVTATAVNSSAVPGPVADTNGVVDNTPDSLLKARTARPVSGSTRRGDNPVLFLVGNSTMRTGTLGNGDNGQWGWGYYLPDFFDTTKITVENHALGGMSSRTFYKQLWHDVLASVRPGDWVIIELGHNDNGPYDSGRARASIPGIGDETLPVVIKETGERDTVLTYGGYMRRFVRDVKARGGRPLLFSLTPRNAWVDADSTVIARVSDTYGKWAKSVAEEENVPFVDLNDITATKYERFGKDKVKTMFYLDRIHTSAFGAVENARSAVEGIRALEGVELKDFLLPEPVDTVTGKSRKPGRPVVFTIGDSTVKNEDKDDDSMWGWGSVIGELFDTTRISVENHAMAGRSARTFLDEGRWDKVYKALQPGDYVIMQFGHNDGGDINTGKARGELHGSGPESKVFRMERTGINQVIYTYGWYLRKFIMDTREKGAIPVVLSHTPRNRWHNGTIESNSDNFGAWARDAAKQSGAYFIDLNTISGRKLQALGEANTDKFFKNDHTHSSLAGARLNAASIARGLRDADCPLADYILDKPLEIDFTKEVPEYSDFNGSGYDLTSLYPAGKGKPFYFSADVPDGNYIVTVTFGDKKNNGHTMVRAEGRRLMLAPVKTAKGKTETRSFTVSKKSPAINLRDTVMLHTRELGTPGWDRLLTLEFTGDRPAVNHISLRRASEADSITTVFLAGNSTVVDQVYEPWCSWGQIVPAFFDRHIVIANHAESGESASSFISEKRLDKILSEARPGDYIIVEFGHNDQKERGPGKGAYYNFATNLKIFIDRARSQGVTPILATPIARRRFDADGRIINTHGEYLDAVREVAARENVPLVDLNAMSAILYETLGPDRSRDAFVHYPAGTFPGQEKALADDTHFNPYGATQIAMCMLQGIKTAVPELGARIINFDCYDPSQPHDPENFYWPQAPVFEAEKPYGN